MRYGSRKFILALLSVASASGLVYVGSIGDTVYGATMGSIIMAYFAGNVAQHIGLKAQ